MVSVVIPVFNGEKTLARAIASVFIQSAVEELLVVDDGSSDGTGEVIQGMQEILAAGRNAIRLTLLRHTSPMGVSSARNLGLHHARCPFIAFLDADDAYLPDRFGPDLLQLAANPRLDGIYSPVTEQRACTSLGQTAGRNKNPRIIGRDLGNGPLLPSFLGSPGSHFLLAGLLLRTEAARRVGAFDALFSFCQDTDWLLRVVDTLSLVPSSLQIPRTLIYLHDQNRSLHSEAAFCFRMKLLEKYLPMVLQRYDFSFFQRLTFVRSMLETSPGKNGDRFQKVLSGLRLMFSHPRLAFWMCGL